MVTRAEAPESSGGRMSACVAIFTGYAIAAPGANTDIPFVDAGGAAATTFKVSPSATAVRVTVAVTTGGVFDLRVTNGTTAYTIHFNAGTALTAAVLYTFTFGARRFSTTNGTTELTYSFRVATDSIINYLMAEEVSGPVV